MGSEMCIRDSAETAYEEVEAAPTPVASAPASVNEETDTLSYFAQLAKDD